MKTERFLVECKQTDKASRSIKLSEIKKIKREALQSGRDWLLSLEIQGTRLVVMSEDTFLEMADEPEDDA